MNDTPHPVLHHVLDGQGPPLVLGPSLGTSTTVWEPQLAALARDHRVLRWDLPGHGGSPAGLLPGDGTASVATLAALVLRTADTLGWERFAYAGISLGGAVGLELAVRHPHRLSSLALACSSARFGPPQGWRERAATVRARGTAALAGQSAARWFGSAPPHAPLPARLLEDLRCADSGGYAACCEALARFDARAALPGVTTPTLVVAGLDDPATPPPHARELATGIPGARLTEIPAAAHLAGVDRPEEVTVALRAHLEAHRDDGRPAHHSDGRA